MGNNVLRVRNDRNYTQLYMGEQLGISQQAYSNLERKPVIEDETLERIAVILSEPIESFKVDNTPGPTGNIFQESGNLGPAVNYYNMNPIEKVAELYEKLQVSMSDQIEALKATIKAQQAVIDVLKEKKS